MLTWIALGCMGKLIMWLWEMFPIRPRGIPFFDKLFTCHLCMGVWVYTFLSFVFGMIALDWFPYIPVFSEFLTGAILSFIVHLVSSGWNSEYRDLIVG